MRELMLTDAERHMLRNAFNGTPTDDDDGPDRDYLIMALHHTYSEGFAAIDDAIDEGDVAGDPKANRAEHDRNRAAYRALLEKIAAASDADCSRVLGECEGFWSGIRAAGR